MVSAFYNTLVGTLELTASERGLHRIHFCDISGPDSDIPPQLRDTVKQLDEYFNKQRTCFDLPLVIEGTEFQKKVWNRIAAIGYGETLTYKQLAEAAGNSKAARAAGMACNRNRLPIVIPCHRVVGTGGKLIGFGGGLDKKRMLLQLEEDLF